MFNISFNETENSLICTFKGRMDSVSAKEIEENFTKQFHEIYNKHNDIKVTFDLDKVDYIASAFMRICLATAKALQEGNFTITNTTPMIKKTFKVAGLDTVLNVL